MAGEGKITAQVVYDSLSGATDKLQAMFDKMPVTMSQAFGVVKITTMSLWIILSIKPQGCQVQWQKA